MDDDIKKLYDLLQKADQGPWWYDGRDIFHKDPNTNIDQIIIPIVDKNETYTKDGAVKDATAKLAAMAPDLAREVIYLRSMVN